MVSLKQKTSKIELDKIKKSGRIEKKQKTKQALASISVKAQTESKLDLQKNVIEVKKSKIKYVMPTKAVRQDLVISCLGALEQLAAHHKKKNVLFDDETKIFAEIHCIKIQNCRGNFKFVLPHSTMASTGEVCLITPDIKKGRKIDHEPTVDRWEETLKKAGVTNVKTVLPVRQLKVEFDQYELKRRLLTQHDFIMVDTRVLNHVSHLLGKMFFKKHNMLIPVRINENGDIKKDIDAGLRTAMLRLNEGHTSTIVVGHTGMPKSKLVENVMSLIQQICTKYPGGEANIRSISLKLPLSLSLPLYITLRPSDTVNAPKLTQKKPKHFTVLEDELSTIPKSKVRVAPDGTVHLTKTEDFEMSGVDEDYETEGSNDEESIKETYNSD